MISYSPGIVSRIQTKKHERLQIISTLENLMQKHHGKVFRMPRAGESVVLLLSGGLDSVVLWGMLLGKYKLRVYPVFLIRGKRSDNTQEERAIDHYAGLYKQLFASVYTPPHKFKLDAPDLYDPHRNMIAYLHSGVIMRYVQPDGTLSLDFNFGHFSSFLFTGFLYTRFLNARENLHIRTIFSGATFSDGAPYRSLTAARSITLSFRALSGEPDWQYTSLAYEPSIRSLLTKSDLITWANNNGIELDRSWSCGLKKRRQCGACLACHLRQRAFKEAGVQDNTRYGNDLWKLGRITPGGILRRMRHIGRLTLDLTMGKRKSLDDQPPEGSATYKPPRMTKIQLKV
jgi:7-cyano-7-deazaguanine synthase in queuosine biosynthesis